MITLVQFIKEALSKELEAEKKRLYKRFNGKNPLEFWKYLCNEKTEDVIKRFEVYQERLNDLYEYAKEDDESLSFDKYVEEADWVIGEEVFKTRKDYINFLNKFEKEKDKKAFLLSDEVIKLLNLSRESGLNSFQNILAEYDYNNHIEFIEEISNTWCVHFLMSGKEKAPGFVFTGKQDNIDEFISIIKNGFKVGTPYPNTDKFGDEDMQQVYASLGNEKVENGINFAYELDYAKYNFNDITDIGGRLMTKSHYGFLGLVFKCEGIVVYHNKDREYQVLFNGKSAEDITPIIADHTQNLWGIIKNVSRGDDGISYEFEKQFKTWEELMNYFKSNK